MVDVLRKKQKLVFVIVKKGKAKRILKALQKAGAEGSTVIPGRGMSVHQERSFLGIPIEDEKECILSIIPEDIKDKVLSKVKAAVRLDRHGNGIAFVLNPSIVTGVAHLLNHNYK
jgi:nitrogen regulatory protein P-II 1